MRLDKAIDKRLTLFVKDIITKLDRWRQHFLILIEALGGLLRGQSVLL